MKEKPEKFQFTREILNRARRLRNREGGGRDGKTPWAEVANILECPSTKSLMVTVHRDDAGKRKNIFEKLEKERKKIENRVIKSRGRVQVTTLAKEFGVTKAAMSERLTRLGFDAEVRAEMGKKLRKI